MDKPLEAFEITWGNAEVVTPAVLSLDAFSVANAEGNFPSSVLFDNAKVELQGIGSTPSATWIGTFRLPVTLSVTRIPCGSKAIFVAWC